MHVIFTVTHTLLMMSIHSGLRTFAKRGKSFVQNLDSIHATITLPWTGLGLEQTASRSGFKGSSF
jgi:hypothetical protein